MDSWSTIDIFRALNLAILALVFIGYPALSIVALFALRKRRLAGVATAIWALIILFIPILGALSLWIVNPQKNSNTEEIKG